MDSMGTLPGMIVQAQVKKSAQAGDVFFLNLYKDLIMMGPKKYAKIENKNLISL
jgi:hypothetical protein